MKVKYEKVGTLVTCLLVFAITQVYFGVSFAKPNAKPESTTPEPPPIIAMLTTRNNRPITVNGKNAISGATILTGTIIETPDQVGGVITLGSLSSLEIEPNSKIKLEFDENGNLKVTVMRGCATARTKKNVTAQIDTEQGVAGKTDPNSRGFLSVCFPPGGTVPIVSTVAVGAASTGGIGWGTLLKIFITAGTGTAVLLGLRGTNPSPSAP